MLKRVPHTYVIIFLLILFCAVCTWVIPGGEFERERVMVNQTEREVIQPGSFRFIEGQPQTWEVHFYYSDWWGVLDYEREQID